MNAKWLTLTISAVAFIIGVAAHVIALGVIGVLGLMFWFVLNGQERRSRRLGAIINSAAPGATRVETVRQDEANGMINRYTSAGWVVDGQSTAKSLGSRAQVTLTFRKP